MILAISAAVENTLHVTTPLCMASRMVLCIVGILSVMTSWAEEQGESGNCRRYSHDYGRTWTELVKLPTAPDGCSMDREGNSLIERDEKGVAVLMAETGQTLSKGPCHDNPCCGCIRWSRDGGRTWENFSWPDEWRWEDAYEGKTRERGTGEGALVRAANGWLVAALRTDMPQRFLPLHYDAFEGAAVSISKDDGQTWSPLNFVFGPGRHHANLIRLPNDDLVMTVIRPPAAGSLV